MESFYLSWKYDGLRRKPYYTTWRCKPRILAENNFFIAGQNSAFFETKFVLSSLLASNFTLSMLFLITFHNFQ